MSDDIDKIGGIGVDIEADVSKFNAALDAADERLNQLEQRKVNLKFTGISEQTVARMERAAAAAERMAQAGGRAPGGGGGGAAAREGGAAARENGSTAAAQGSIDLELKGGSAALRSLIEDALSKPFQITIEIENIQALRTELEGLTGKVTLEHHAAAQGAYAQQPVGGHSPFRPSADLSKALGGSGVSDNIQMMFEGVNDALKALGEQTLGMTDDAAEMLHRMSQRFGDNVESVMGAGSRGSLDVGGRTGELIAKLKAANKTEEAEFLRVTTANARGALSSALPAYRSNPRPMADNVFTAPASGPATAPAGTPTGGGSMPWKSVPKEEPTPAAAPAPPNIERTPLTSEPKQQPAGPSRQAFVPKPFSIDDLVKYALKDRDTPARAGSTGNAATSAAQAERSRANRRAGTGFADMLGQLGIDAESLGKGDARVRATAELLDIPLGADIYKTDDERRKFVTAQLRKKTRAMRHVFGMTDATEHLPDTQTGVYGPSKVLPRAGDKDAALKAQIPSDLMQVDSAGKPIMAPAGWVDPLTPAQRARVNSTGRASAQVGGTHSWAIGNSGGRLDLTQGPQQVPGARPSDTGTTTRPYDVAGKNPVQASSLTVHGINLDRLTDEIKRGREMLDPDGIKRYHPVYQGIAEAMDSHGKGTGTYVRQNQISVNDELESLGTANPLKAGGFRLRPGAYGELPGHTGQFRGVSPNEMVRRTLAGMNVPQATIEELLGEGGKLQPFLASGAANINRHPELMRGPDVKGGAFAPNSARSLTQAAKDELERRDMLRQLDAPGLEKSPELVRMIMDMDQRQREAAHAAGLESNRASRERIDAENDDPLGDQSSVKNKNRAAKATETGLHENVKVVTGDEIQSLDAQLGKMVDIWDNILKGDLPETSLSDERRGHLEAIERDSESTPSQKAAAKAERLNGALTSRQGIRQLVSGILEPVYNALGLEGKQRSTTGLTNAGLVQLPAAVQALFGHHSTLFGSGSPGAGYGRGALGTTDEGVGFVKPGFLTEQAERRASSQDTRATRVLASEIVKPKATSVDQAILKQEQELKALQNLGVNFSYGNKGGTPLTHMNSEGKLVTGDILSAAPIHQRRTPEELMERRRVALMANKTAGESMLGESQQDERARWEKERKIAARNISRGYDDLIAQAENPRSSFGVFEEIGADGKPGGKLDKQGRLTGFITGRERNKKQKKITQGQAELARLQDIHNRSIAFGSDPKWLNASVDEVVAAAPADIQADLRERLSGNGGRLPGTQIGEPILKDGKRKLSTGDEIRKGMAENGATPPGGIPAEPTPPGLRAKFAEDRAAASSDSGETPPGGPPAPPERGGGGASASSINVRIIGSVPLDVRILGGGGGGGPVRAGGARNRDADLRANMAAVRDSGSASKWAKKYKDEGWSEAEIKSVLGEHYNPGVANRAVRDAFAAPAAPVGGAPEDATTGAPDDSDEAKAARAIAHAKKNPIVKVPGSKLAVEDPADRQFSLAEKAAAREAKNQVKTEAQDKEREAKAAERELRANEAKADAEEKAARNAAETQAAMPKIKMVPTSKLAPEDPAEKAFRQAEKGAQREANALNKADDRAFSAAERSAATEAKADNKEHQRQQDQFEKAEKLAQKEAQKQIERDARQQPNGMKASRAQLAKDAVAQGMDPDFVQKQMAGFDTPKGAVDRGAEQFQPQAVIDARQRAKNAAASLPSRAPSTMMVQLFQRMFGGRAGPEGRIMALQREAVDLQRMATHQGTLMSQTPQFQGRFDAAQGLMDRSTKIAASGGSPVPKSIMDAYDEAKTALDAHTKSIEDNGKAIDAQTDKMDKMQTATPADQLQNLFAGFAGGVGGGLVTMAIGQITQSVVKALDAIQPLVDDATGGSQRTNRTNQAVSQAITSAGYNPSAEQMLYAQAGLSGEGMNALSVTARGMAGNGQLQQRGDLQQAAFNDQMSQQRLGLPSWASPSLVQAQGGLFSFSGRGTPFASMFGSRAIGGQASTDELTAGILSNGAASATDRVAPDMMGAFFKDPAGVIGAAIAGAAGGGGVGAIGGSIVPGVGTAAGAVIGAVPGALAGWGVGIANASNADPAELARLHSNVGNINDTLKQRGSSASFRIADAGDQNIESTAKAFEDAGFQDMANTVRKLGLALDGTAKSAESVTRVMDNIAKGQVSKEGVLKALGERDIPNMLASIDFQSKTATEGFQSSQALNAIANPLQPIGTGIPGGTQGLNTSGVSNLDRRIGEMNAQNQKGLQTQLSYLNPEDHAAAQQAITDLTEISNLQAKYQKQASNIQANQAWAEYNHQLTLAKRNVSDLAGLVGRSGGSEIGQMERKNLLAQRELTLLQQMMAQRQLNYQRALAGFTYEGATPEEAADRRRIAAEQAKDSQKGLDLQKGISATSFALVDKQNIRQYRDAVKETQLLVKRMESERMVQILSQKIERTSRLQAQFEGEIGVFLQKGQALEKAGWDLATNVADAVGGLIVDVYDDSLKAIKKAAKDLRDAVNGTDTPDTNQKGSNVANGKGNSGLEGQGGQWERLGATAHGGGHTVNFDFSGAQVRSDDDIDQIVRKVEKALNAKAGLFGLTRQPIS